MGAQVVDLQLFQGFGGSDDLYVFPHELLPCGSSGLKHLSLLSCVLSPPSDHFDRFKQLKTLHLRDVQVDENFMASLFSVCLFLESLSLELCTLFYSLIINGPPCLTDLKVLCCYRLEKIEMICAANLASFEYDRKLANISCIETPRLARLILVQALPQRLDQFPSCPLLEELYLQLRNQCELVPQSVSMSRNLKK